MFKVFDKIHGVIFPNDVEIVIKPTLPLIVKQPDRQGSYYVHTGSGSNFTVLQPGPDATATSGRVTVLQIGIDEGAGLRGAVTGGRFYNSTAFPSEYRGNYFFCEYMASRICRATLDGSNQVTSLDYFATNLWRVVDIVDGPDGAFYCASYRTNHLYRIAYTNGPQRLIVSPVALNMAEGGVGTINISLAQPPSTDIAVTVAAESGGAAIRLSQTELVFTIVNYGVPQTIRVDVPADSDSFASQGRITVSAPQLPDEQVWINAYDPDSGKLKFESVVYSNQELRLKVATERNVGVYLEGSTDLKTWARLSTNYSTADSLLLVPGLPAAQTNQFFRAMTVSF